VEAGALPPGCGNAGVVQARKAGRYKP
jgi:hypothetical protein